MRGYLFALLLILSWWGLSLSPAKVSSTSSPVPLDFLLQQALSGEPQAIQQQLTLWGEAPTPIPPSPSQNRWIAQTQPSACMLLALCDPEEIIAVPSRMATLPWVQLPPAIPFADQVCAETLFAKNPTAAFCAPYSRPSTVLAYRNMGLNVYTREIPNRLTAIANEMEWMGQITQHPQKAHALAKLIRLGEKRLWGACSGKRVVALTHYYGYATPGKQSLTAYFLDLLGCENLAPKEGWSAPIELEEVRRLDPDIIIVIGDSATRVAKEPALSGIRAHFVEVQGELQTATSQFALLGLHNLRCAIGR